MTNTIACIVASIVAIAMFILLPCLEGRPEKQRIPFVTAFVIIASVATYIVAKRLFPFATEGEVGGFTTLVFVLGTFAGHFMTVNPSTREPVRKVMTR